MFSEPPAPLSTLRALPWLGACALGCFSASCLAEPEVRGLVIPLVNAPFRVDLLLPPPVILDRNGPAEAPHRYSPRDAQVLTLEVSNRRRAQPVREEMIFRFTVKGWTLWEMDDDNAEFFDIYRVKQKNLRKPELMFSFSQEF